MKEFWELPFPVKISQHDPQISDFQLMEMMDEWCDENCHADWDSQVDTTTFHYRFDNYCEATLFACTWG
jgi:hypothetical protein